MPSDSSAFRIRVLLSVQRALWDMVTPNLRGVAVNPVHPLIVGRFIYESLGDEDRMLVAEVETYIVADFGPEVEVRCIAVASPPVFARDLEPGEEWVYLRRE